MHKSHQIIQRECCSAHIFCLSIRGETVNVDKFLAESTTEIIKSHFECAEWEISFEISLPDDVIIESPVWTDNLITPQRYIIRQEKTTYSLKL